MMELKRFNFILCSFLLLFSVLDVIMTFYGVEMKGLSEFNPLMRSYVSRHLYPLLFVIKVSLASVMFFAVDNSRFQRFNMYVLTALNIAYLIVFLNNLVWIIG